MSLLKREPPAPVRSLDELFAIAAALEEEAASRYADLATQMAEGMTAVAETFERLAAEERGHADQVADWSRARTGAAPDPARIRWRPPETFDQEAAQAIASSRLASAYRALSMAVRNEKRAFALWTYVAAQAEDPAVREAAERMAEEELRHAAQLRRARRRAFHAEHGHRPAAAALATPRPRPAAEAARLERALAALLSALAEAGGAPARQHGAELVRLAGEAAGIAGEAMAAAEAETSGAEAEEGPPAAGARRGHRASPVAAGAVEPEGLSGGALRLAERAAEDYLAAADAARDEEAMRRLQSLAERAIARIVLLRRMAGLG